MNDYIYKMMKALFEIHRFSKSIKKIFNFESASHVVVVVVGFVWGNTSNSSSVYGWKVWNVW